MVLIAAALLGSAFIWYRFFTSAPVAPVVSISGPAGIDVGSKSLLKLLESLGGLKFDLQILDDPLYKGLQDFTPSVVLPESKGRANPFAPF